MGWIKHSEDNMLPSWLKDNLKATCPYCGTEKENFYNSQNRCTARRCPNIECPGTIARKIAAMADILNWKGIAEGTGAKLVRQYDLKNHFQAVPLLWTEKPEITLTNLFRIAFIEGVDVQWADVCVDFRSVEDVLENYSGPLKDVVRENSKILLEGQQYFCIAAPAEKGKFYPLISGNVMISGNIKGYPVRESFIGTLNYASDGLLALKVVGKRKTDVMALIQEADSPNQGKAQTAIENGIPIMTPDDFKNMIMQKLTVMVKEGKARRR